MRAPNAHEGVGIKDIVLENLALGSKLLWWILLGKFEWWKKSLIYKYFSKVRLRSPNNPPHVHKYSHIGKLL
jgi:hypothetical protein